MKSAAQEINSGRGTVTSQGSLSSARVARRDEAGLCYNYVWQELFDLLRGIDCQGYCLAEIAHNP